MNENKPCGNLLIGVSGSIYALNLYHYLRLFRESLAQNIQIIMTANATRMVDTKTVEILLDTSIFGGLWDQTGPSFKVPHIDLTRWADLFVIVPATANIMGKTAHGIADDLLSTAILAYSKPVVFLPAMNITMWKNKAVQRNIQALKTNGHIIVPPTTGLAIATNEPDAVSPTPDQALLHIKEAFMKQLRKDYWEEAISEKPLTPAEKQKREIAQRLNELRKPVS